MKIRELFKVTALALLLGSCGGGGSGATGSAASGAGTNASVTMNGAVAESNVGAAVNAGAGAIEIMRRFSHDSDAYTQGMTFHNGLLYESTGLYGQSAIRIVDPATGEVLRRADLSSQYFGEGATVLSNKLYQLTWQEQTGLIYHLDTLEAIGTFNYAGQGWGLTTDGQLLILSDGSDVLRFMNPDTFEVVRTLSVRDADGPLSLLNELEWVRGEIWANVLYEDRIARINPATGEVKAWLDLRTLTPPIRQEDPDAVLNGIAFDENTGKIFVTGKRWPEYFEIRLVN